MTENIIAEFEKFREDVKAVLEPGYQRNEVEMLSEILQSKVIQLTWEEKRAA